LDTLKLDRTQISDAQLTDLGALKSLRYLDLSVTVVTDAGLEILAAQKNLKHIDLGSTPKVTAAGVAKLRKALPDCRIDSH
jgi:hypothetical protein